MPTTKMILWIAAISLATTVAYERYTARAAA